MEKRRYNTLVTSSLVVSDILMVTLAVVVAYFLRANIAFPREAQNIGPIATYIRFLLIQVLLVVVVLYFYRMYHELRVTTRSEQFYSVFVAVSLASLLTVALSILFFQNTELELDFSRVMLVYSWLLSVAFVTLGRTIHRRVRRNLLEQGVGRERLLVVGSAEAAQVVVQKVQWSPDLGYDLLGIVDDVPLTETVLGVPVVGERAELGKLLTQFRIDEVIVALPPEDRQQMITLIADCQRGQVSIKIFPDTFEIMAGEVSVDDLGGLPLLNIRDVALRGWRLSLKRVFDIAGAMVGLMIASPIITFLAILIKLESKGPAFFVQERVGLDGEAFPMIKLRSMRSDLPEKDGWTVKDDPRRTRMGTFIRKFSLDELPQFINVLLGHMSLVGPRPEQPSYVEKFRQRIPRYMERHREKAGMTGWAQVNGMRGDTSIEERTKYDLWYIEHWSLWLDIRICLRTILQAVGGKAY
ncbi:MAG TPA: undecaprenyl-phosphate glucose phosphotransferase [Anaerolineales bacterium]|nr:undecaprenyl-phosphate glucose phosphotransferase [Anaerolineales bacterium]